MPARKARLTQRFRRRMEQSRLLAGFLAGVIRAHLTVCNRTTRWQVEGLEDLKAALAEGPVMLLIWHEHLMMAAMHWPIRAGRISTLFAASPIGRIAGAFQRQLGMEPMEMSDKMSNRTASRAVLAKVRDGVSIGITGDGPLGPARVLKDAPLDWARVTGMPVFVYAFATTRGRRLDSWDRMLVPLPFARGAQVFARFDTDIPRRPSPEETETLRVELADFLNRTTARVETLVSG